MNIKAEGKLSELVLSHVDSAPTDDAIIIRAAAKFIANIEENLSLLSEAEQGKRPALSLLAVMSVIALTSQAEMKSVLAAPELIAAVERLKP